MTKTRGLPGPPHHRNLCDQSLTKQASIFQMSSPLLQPRPVWSIRLILIGLVAITASLPMAWISLAKVLLFVSSGVYLIAGHYNKRADTACLLYTSPSPRD